MRAVLLLFVLLFAVSVVYGRDISVNATHSLDDAIQEAENGDVIVFAGNHTYAYVVDGYNLYGATLNFTSESGNPSDVILTTVYTGPAFGSIYVGTAYESLWPNTNSTSLSFSGVTFLDCGDSLREDITGGVFELYTEGVTGSISISITNCIFQTNKNAAGGVFYAEKGTGDISITVTNSTFVANEAYYGGVFMLYGTTLNIVNSTFEDNVAQLAVDSAGGVIFVDESSNVIISNSRFINNGAYDDGGVILATTGSSLSISDSTFSGNEALDEGGAIFIQYGPVNIVNSEFDSNWAYNSGALFIAGNGGIAIVEGCTFKENIANNSGGAIVVFQDSNLTISDSSILDNTAFQGGAIYVEGANATLVNVSVTGNTADQGGAFFVDSGSVVSVQSSSISGNGATSAGASLYCNGSSFALDQSTFASVNNNNDVDGIWCDNSTSANSCSITSDTVNLSNTCVDHAPASGNSNHLAGWKVAIIVIFVIVGVALVVVGVIIFLKKKKAGSFSRM